LEDPWLILPKPSTSDKIMDADAKLSDIINQIEDGRGWRFSDEQADTLAKLVDNLIKQMKAYKEKRNKGRKQHRFIFIK
jgi:hypothetical protein